MIDLNLIPSHLRRKKKAQLFKGINMPLEVVIGLGGGLFMLLIVVHVLLLVTNLEKLSKHKKLQKEWESILPAKVNVDEVINQMRDLQNKFKAVEEITSASQISWSQKLNIISDSLPREVWLTKIALNGEMFFIEGSAISKESQEMINVLRLASNLKGAEAFLDDLTGLEVGSIQKRFINKVEIEDFVITASLK